MEENVIETAETVVEETAAPAPVEAAAPAQEQQPAREAREPRETRERPAKRNFKKQSRKVCIFCQEKAALRRPYSRSWLPSPGRKCRPCGSAS